MSESGWTKKINLAAKYRYGLLIIAVMIMLLDQLTKYIIRQSLHPYEVVPVIKNFWNWTLTYNKGAAFSFLADHQGNWPKLFFGLVAVLVSIWLVNFLLSKFYSKLSGLSMCFILGGALGNLVDRIIHGRVTDFIQWYYQGFYWPAFNLADSFICVGVVLLLIEGIFFTNNQDNKKGL
jgi:signal peptidase II